MKPEERTRHRRRSLIFIARLLAAYLLLLAIVSRYPALFPRAATRWVSTMVNRVDPDYDASRVTVSERSITIRVTSRKFSRLTTVDGTPGPFFTCEPSIQAEVLNTYPLIALSVILAWPLAGRVRVLALLFCALLLPVVCSADLAAFAMWMAADLLPTAWLDVRNAIPQTPENLAIIETLRAHHEGWKRLDWILSTSRPFFAIVLGLLSLGLALLAEAIWPGSSRDKA